MSDLHFEYHKDRGKQFIDSLDPTGVDALILAGDIGEISVINGVIESFCAKYKNIIMVKGNHEYYNSNREDIIDNFASLEEQFPNFHLLNNKIFELDGKRFLGSTLWYPYVNYYLAREWMDFNTIKGLSSWVHIENEEAKKFFEDNLQEGDIVITHMLPSPQCIHKMYQGDPSNIFYVSNMEYLIEERKPARWFFGHTHKKVDLTIGDTKVRANPRGYVMFHETEEENGFDPNLKIDI